MNLWQALELLSQSLNRPMEWLVDANWTRVLGIGCTTAERKSALLTEAFFLYRDWKKRNQLNTARERAKVRAAQE